VKDPQLRFESCAFEAKLRILPLPSSSAESARQPYDDKMLTTNRLDLVPLAARDYLALMDGAESFTATFGVPSAQGVGEFMSSGEVSPQFMARLEANREAPADPWSFGFALVHRDARLVVGMAGFKGPPAEDGTVEIAYGVAPSFRNQGLATEAARALVAFACADPRIRRVLAHTLREPNPSTRVLTKCGFTCRGDVEDPEDGTVWRWEWMGQPAVSPRTDGKNGPASSVFHETERPWPMDSTV